MKIVNRLTVNYFYNKFQLKCSTEFWICLWIMSLLTKIWARGGSKTAATSKMELFVITVNGFKPLAIITKSSTLDVSAVLDPPLWAWMILFSFNLWFYCTSTFRWQKRVCYRNNWLIYLLLMWKGACQQFCWGVSPLENFTRNKTTIKKSKLKKQRNLAINLK